MPTSKADVIIVNESFEPRSAKDVFLKHKAAIIQALRQNLIELDKDQPGNLIQSINVDIEHKGSKLTFTLEMEDYWKYVDAGRKQGSKMPPQAAMLEFIKVRGIKANVKKIQTGLKSKRIKKALKQINRDRALKQLAFAIGKSIKKKGIKPTYFFSDVVNEDLYLRLKEDLTKALGQDIELSFQTKN